MSNASPDMRTPMSKVRHLGSARSGTEHAWRMRATSIALVPLTLAFVWLVPPDWLGDPMAHDAGLIAWIGSRF